MMARRRGILTWVNMRLIWENYIGQFRKLLRDGWTIYKTGNSKVRTWVYPYTSLPTKFRMRDAIEINNIADSFNRVAGTTRTVNVACSIFFNTERCIKGEI